MKKKFYIIKNEMTDKYIALDKSSGGYPYETDLEIAHIFKTKEEVVNYKNMFKRMHPTWVICVLTLNEEIEKTNNGE